jgi:ubiquinone/menaquinone biosynthesis C-methylase UbiE
MTAPEQLPLLEHEDVARRGYDRQADVYDAERYLSSNGRFHFNLFREELLRAVDPAAGGRILDLATGTGVGAACFFGSPASVFGADLSNKMMAVARARAAKAGQNFPLAQSSARTLPFRSGSFRALLSLRFFHHVPHAHRRPIVEEISRVLVPGGIAVLDFKNPFYGIVINKIRDLMGDRQGHYLHPWRVRALFEGLEIVALHGVYMPFAVRLASLSSRLAAAYLRLGARWPFKYLCMNLFVVVRKPAHARP